MTQLVVALDAARAALCAKREGLTGKWQAVTPDNYRLLDRLAALSEEFVWDFDNLPWGSWSLPTEMTDAIRACMHRAQS